MVTSFRGFYQFGVMGAVGALFCWVATFTVLPAMLALLDRRQRPAGHAKRARRWSWASLAALPAAATRALLIASGSPRCGVAASSASGTSCRTRSSTTSASSTPS